MIPCSPIPSSANPRKARPNSKPIPVIWKLNVELESLSFVVTFVPPDSDLNVIPAATFEYRPNDDLFTQLYFTAGMKVMNVVLASPVSSQSYHFL